VTTQTATRAAAIYTVRRASLPATHSTSAATPAGSLTRPSASPAFSSPRAPRS
jgi:hypothetical protein